jgi:hypothetical protein
MDIGAITAKIEKAISELVELKITTQVGDKVLKTTIDLEQGDISMTIDPWFNEPEQKPLLDMHLQREKQGAEIVKQNVEALSRLIKLLPELKKVV